MCFSGTISTVRPFDRETTPVYRLVVQSGQAGGGATNTTVVTVEVNDENDNVPNFLGISPLAFSVAAGVPNAFVGQIRVCFNLF